MVNHASNPQRACECLYYGPGLVIVERPEKRVRSCQEHMETLYVSLQATKKKSVVLSDVRLSIDIYGRVCEMLNLVLQNNT